MNTKIITISLVAILGVAGGAYTLMKSDMNITQYIPEPISKFLGYNAEETSDFVDNTPTFVYEEEQAELDKPVENAADSTEKVNVEEEVVANQQEEPSNIEPKNSIDEASSNVSQEDEAYKEIAETINKNITSDEISISQQIEAANSEIYKLEAENIELEALFQKILRQNRALAKKLRDLDEKIAALN